MNNVYIQNYICLSIFFWFNFKNMYFLKKFMVFTLDAEFGFEVCFFPTETDYISWLQEEEMLAFAFQSMRQIFFFTHF